MVPTLHTYAPSLPSFYVPASTRPPAMPSMRPPAEPPPLATTAQHNRCSPIDQVKPKRRFHKPPDISFHPKPSSTDLSRSKIALLQAPKSPATNTTTAPKRITLIHNPSQVKNCYRCNIPQSKPRYRFAKPAWNTSYIAMSFPMKTEPSSIISQDTLPLPHTDKNQKEATKQNNHNETAANKIEYVSLKNTRQELFNDLQELFDQQRQQLQEMITTMQRIIQLMHQIIQVLHKTQVYNDYWSIYETQKNAINCQAPMCLSDKHNNYDMTPTYQPGTKLCPENPATQPKSQTQIKPITHALTQLIPANKSFSQVHSDRSRWHRKTRHKHRLRNGDRRLREPSARLSKPHRRYFLHVIITYKSLRTYANKNAYFQPKKALSHEETRKRTLRKLRHRKYSPHVHVRKYASKYLRPLFLHANLRLCMSSTPTEYYSHQGRPPDPHVLLRSPSSGSAPTEYYSTQGRPPDRI